MKPHENFKDVGFTVKKLFNRLAPRFPGSLSPEQEER